MRLLYAYLFPVLWLAYFIYWRVMAGNVKTTRRQEPGAQRMFRAIAFLLALLLLIDERMPPAWLHWQILPSGNWTFFGGAAVTAAGLLFSIWARRHLGRNWSQSVTVKDDHELIVSGPYSVVRHPIYTGLLTGFLGTAIAVAELRGILALAIVLTALWIKLRLEERWMRTEFGEPYERYSHRVAALVPFIL